MKTEEEEYKPMTEKKRLYYAAFFPALFCSIIVLTFLFERAMDFNFSGFGIWPRTPKSLLHIFIMPFIHADWGHLTGNILSFFVLGTCLYYFYGEIAGRVLLLAVTIGGIILWTIGREASHIGLSGVIYALSFFLFFSGILRRHIPLMAISLAVVFLYGHHVWFLFPWEQNEPISWEGHLSGAISGTMLALVYRNRGVQSETQIWTEDNDDEHDENDDNAFWKTGTTWTYMNNGKQSENGRTENDQ